METVPSTTAPAVRPTGCCPPYQPGTWDYKEIIWEDRPFVTTHVHSLFHVPLDMGRKVKSAMERIEEAHAAPSGLMLSDEKSPWGADLFIDVTGPVPGAEMANLSGTFLTREFEGSFRDIPRWMDSMRDYVAAKDRKLEKLYFAYTTCPSCAKAYGKNYVVLFAQVS